MTKRAQKQKIKAQKIRERNELLAVRLALFGIAVAILLMSAYAQGWLP